LYGIINNAFRAYVIAERDEETWQDIALKARIDACEFAGMQPYDDAVTMAIVVETAKRLGIEADDLLRVVGRSWLDFTQTTPLASLSHAPGSDSISFIENLDAMHSRLRAALPEMQAPSFTIERLGSGRISITYFSDRDGLFAFVEGLLLGVSDYFDETLDIKGFERLGDGHARWLVSISKRSAVA